MTIEIESTQPDAPVSAQDVLDLMKCVEVATRPVLNAIQTLMKAEGVDESQP